MLARLCKSKFDSGNQSAAKACASVEEVLDCNVCDFQSNWFTGLQVHNKFSHVNINEDYKEKYEDSSKYWETGTLGSVYQTFLDVNTLLDEVELSESKKWGKNEGP